MLGLDIGTSGCKAILFDDRWNVVARSYRRYDLVSAGENRYDLVARTVWENLREAITEVHAGTDARSDAVAVSALGDVIIPLDESGNEVRPSIIDFDPRGKEEIRAFVEGYGADKLFETTGMPPIHINSLAKILWIRKHEPLAFEKVRRWATYEDWVLQKLGAKPAVSHSMAARTMLFDIHRKTWSPDILAAAGLRERDLPEAVPSGEVVARLDARTAGELGFSDGAVACSGGHDMVCAAIGAGLDVNDPSTALNIMGTMEAVIVLTKKPNVKKAMLRNMYPCYPAYREYISLSLNFTSGSVLSWYRNLFSGLRGPGENDVGGYDELLKDMDTGMPGELLFVPHFSGVCNPVFDPDARGFLYGLSLGTSPRDLTQGIVEGLCYDLKSHIRAFGDAGFPIARLKVVGGGAQSDSWLQLKANITGLEVTRSDLHEASAIGAAALCGKAVGVIDDPYKAPCFMKLKETRFVPAPEAALRFEEKFLRYLSLNKRVGMFETR
jgi:xylulokinase